MTNNKAMRESGLHAGLCYDGLHLASEVVEAVVGGSGYVDGLLHNYFDILLYKNNQQFDN